MDTNDPNNPGQNDDELDTTAATNKAQEDDKSGEGKKAKATEIPADVLKKAVDEALAPIKAKLDDAYTKRDEALAKSAEHEQKVKDIERERMREQGKETEALQSELEELRAKDKTKDGKIIELTRNMEVNSMLAGLEFRNDKSRKMAFEEIVGELVQDENGNWKHKSGSDLNKFVSDFSQDEDNSFLFKSKESSGAGSLSPKPSSPSANTGSLFELSQDEVLKRAQEGTLKKR